MEGRADRDQIESAENRLQPVEVVRAALYPLDVRDVLFQSTPFCLAEHVWLRVDPDSALEEACELEEKLPGPAA